MPEPKTGATIMFTEPVWSQFEIPDPNGRLCTGPNRKCSGTRRIAARILKSTAASFEIEVLDSDGYDPYPVGTKLRRKKSEIDGSVLGGAAVL
jgi:hypothetical protein